MLFAFNLKVRSIILYDQNFLEIVLQNLRGDIYHTNISFENILNNTHILLKIDWFETVFISLS